MATIVEAFVGKYLLDKLAAFTEEKVVMILGVKDELNTLQRKMSRIAAYVRDAERRRITDESVNQWLNELKDVMYDADDLIDLWIYRYHSLSSDEPSNSSKSPSCCPFPFFSCIPSIPFRNKVAQQIKTLIDRLEDILNDMAKLNLQAIQPEDRTVGRVNAPVSSPLEVDVVGNEIKKAVNELVDRAVTDNRQKFNLIAITGMGGIGKTTLAQKIYNNRMIQNRYTERMWLSVSQSKSLAQLIKVAIRNIGGDPGNSDVEIDELLPILAKTISGKSFFLVLDDVWNVDQSVNLLQNALKSSATYGFILVTTRDQRVAMRMDAQYIHQMEVLSSKSGWELLLKRAYLTDIHDILNLEEVGTKIVENCGGLPLAIEAIAGILATKNKSKNEWENVLKNSAWSIRGLPMEIDRALYLSYEDLSPQLKQCFLYYSLFNLPGGLMFRDDLVRFWIAEGLVEERSWQAMESTAQDYYYELIRRHLLEPDHSVVDHNKCRMHDVLRSLAQYLSKEETFTGDHVLPNHNVISRLRRLSLTEANEGVCIPHTATTPLRLRTFLIFKCLSQIENRTFLGLKHLRVLYINEKGLNSIPESIGDMIHLRMLDLDRTSISTLPESIGSLTNLLFLQLNGCELLHTLPRGITRLCNLRHLYLRDAPLTSVPKGIGGLKKLTEIRGFQVAGDGNHDGWDLQEFEGLSQLTTITITKLERARNASVVLANKNHLKRLRLVFSKVVGSSGHMEELEIGNSCEILGKLHPPPCIEQLWISDYGGQMLPSWMSSPPQVVALSNLQYLVLIGWSCCTDLPSLGVLPNLKYLRVKDASSIVSISPDFLGIRGWTVPNFPTVFPKLEHLLLENMPNLEEWVLSDEGENSPSFRLMPHMKTLAIENCPKLRALPEGLQQLTALKKLFVREADSIKSIQDFPFRCESLELRNNRCLESLLNLPGVKKVHIRFNPNLRYVSKLDSLEHLSLEHYTMMCLPEWLMKFMDERKGRKADKIHFDLLCKTALFERCLKDGPDWPIIKCFSSVSVYNEERSASLEYTREPESYYASL